MQRNENETEKTQDFFIRNKFFRLARSQTKNEILKRGKGPLSLPRHPLTHSGDRSEGKRRKEKKKKRKKESRKIKRVRAGSVFLPPLRLFVFFFLPPLPLPSHSISLLQLLLRAELVGVAALLLAAVGGARVEASVAPKKFFFVCLKKKSERKSSFFFSSQEMSQC